MSTPTIQVIINASNSAELFAILSTLRPDVTDVTAETAETAPAKVEVVIPGPKLVPSKEPVPVEVQGNFSTPAPAPAPKPVVVVPEVIVPEKAITLEGIQEALKKVSPGQLDKLRTILADFAAKRLSDVPADKLVGFWVRCEKEVLA